MSRVIINGGCNSTAREIRINNSGGGTVSINPQSSTYAENIVVNNNCVAITVSCIVV